MNEARAKEDQGKDEDKTEKEKRSLHISKFGVERNRKDALVCSNKECEQICEVILILM